MRQLSVLLLCFCFLITSKAQNVGIGTNAPDASARLDITDNARGLLIPRMTAAERNAIASPANGLLLFVTSDSSFFYYYNGWKKISIANEVWNLKGNSGTSDGNNFIGTTDNTALTLRMNNQPSGRIDSSNSNTFWGYQSGISSAGKFNTASGFQSFYSNTTGHHNTAAGNQALYNNVSGYDNSAFGNRSLFANVDGFANTAAGDWSMLDNVSGYHNAAFGINALIRNISGYQNAGFGVAALAANKTGFDNTAAGFLSLYSDTTGNSNTASGKQSLYNNGSGNFNTALGIAAGFTNTTGNNNTLIGSNADVTATGLTTAGAIGYNAKVAASNCFVIGGTGADAVNVGIGTTTPTERLDVIGNIKATGTITPSDWRFKTNINPLENSLQKIISLNGVSYNWKVVSFPNRGFDNELQIGFIAQEVEKIFPQIVHTGTDGYKGIDYAKLVPALAEAIKEQQKQIDELKKLLKKNK